MNNDDNVGEQAAGMLAFHRKNILVLAISVCFAVVWFRVMTADKEPPSPRGHLRQWYPENTSFVQEDPKLTIIVIPELGRSTSETYKETWDWLEDDLRRIAPLAEILMFEYDLEYEDGRVWRLLLQKGQSLLHSLVKEGQLYGLGDRPILFICHGLGGLILKRALVTMNQQFHDPGFQRFLNLSSGLVFFGTPHPNFNHKEQWFRLGLMLRSDQRISRIMRAQAEMEANILAYVSREFDHIDVDTPVLSVFETKATKISEGFLKRSRREILVDKSFAEIQAKYEKLIEAPADHHEVHRVRSGSAVFNEIEDLVRKALREVPPSERLQASVQFPMTAEQWENTASEIMNDDADKLFVPSSSALHTTEDSSERIDAKMASIATTDILKSNPAPSLPCYMLDAAARAPEFYGKEEIFPQLEEALLPGRNEDPTGLSSGLQVFALSGVGGVGKTQIATKFAYAHKTDFDAVFWIQADSVAKLAESFRKIASTMKLIDPSEEGNYVVAHNLVMQWLINPTRSDATPNKNNNNISWLVVYDNADDLELLRDYWPVEGSHGSILITSRDPLAKSYQYGTSNGIDIEPLNTEDGASLLRRLTGQAYNPSAQQILESQRLSSRLGGLPLAISTLAAIIRRRELRYEEMLRLYEEDYSIAYSKPTQVSSQEDPYERSMSTVWTLEKFTDEAAILLDVISLLDPDGIQEQILLSQVSAPSIQAWPSSYNDYTKARAELLKSSLIIRNQELDQLIVHRMVQDSAKHGMSSARLKDVFSLVVELLISTSPSDPVKFSHTTSAWKTGQQLLPHILRLDGLCEKHPDLVENKHTRGVFAELLKQGGWYLKERGSFDLAKPLLKRALELAEAQELRADLLFSFASLAGESNDAKDHLYYAQKHLYAREETKRRDKDLGMAYAELSISLSNNGRYEEGLTAGQESLKIYQQTEEYLQGVYWPHFAIIHQALALLAMGRGVEAIDMLKDTLAWREEQYGVNDTESFKLGYVLQVLGNVYVQEGRWDEATEAYQKALANYKATVGMNYHRSGHLCVKLAECHAQHKEFETAEIFLDQAIASFSSQNFYQREVMRATFIKAQSLREQQDEAGYEELIDQVQKMYKEIVPFHQRIKGEPITRDLLDEMVFIWAR